MSVHAPPKWESSIRSPRAVIEIVKRNRGMQNDLYCSGVKVAELSYEHVGVSERWVLRVGRVTESYRHAQDAIRVAERYGSEWAAASLTS